MSQSNSDTADNDSRFSPVFVKLPDGTVQTYAAQTTCMEIAREIGEEQAARVIAAEINGKIVDTFRPLADLVSESTAWSHDEVTECSTTGKSQITTGSTREDALLLRLLDPSDDDATDVLLNSALQVMARAVMRVFQGVSLGFGQTTQDGFHYDFALDAVIGEDDFPRIEAEMQSIRDLQEPFEHITLIRDEARMLLEDLGQGLKVEQIDAMMANRHSVGFYRQGEFIDTCAGPHLPHAGKINEIQLSGVTTSSWNGRSKHLPLQRLWGTASFAT